MPRRLTVLLLGLLVAMPLVAQHRHPAAPPPPYVEPGPPPVDVFTLSDLTVTATHLDLDLTVDFDQHQVRGSATETLSNPSGATKFIVDTRDLTISSVKIDGAATKWSLGPSTGMGSALTIDIRPDTRVVRIDYASTTNARSTTLNWLDPLATDGDIAPFFYTFSEPDRARGWIPLQDTPSVRVTYDAKVHVPRGLLAVMSCDNNPTATSADGNYAFSMKEPIPSYLIALAVGRMEFHSFSDRTGFYAEPENVDDAIHDLAYLPDMFDAAQRLMGPYPFTRYDVVLMPPNFHAGGMENPNANFIDILDVVWGNNDATPLYSNTVSHEMAHSWTGDLVTCATWGDVWLNEGFAEYFQGRIFDAMGMPDRAELESYFDRSSWDSYAAAVAKTPSATLLHHDLTRDDSVFTGFNGVYQKGSLFLKMIEDREGKPAFDAMMRDWLTRYRFHWVDAHAFLEMLQEHFGSPDAIRANDWIYNSGLPATVTAPTAAKLYTLALDRAAAVDNGATLDALGASNWTAQEVVLFLMAMSTSLKDHMADVDAALHLSSKKFVELNWWVRMADTRYAPGLPGFEAFFRRAGGNVVLGYQELAKTPEGVSYALDVYRKMRPNYDWTIQLRVDQMLHYPG